MVCYAGKQEKPFWFNSLDQIVEFGAIIFCRAFKNYFGQFVWIEKKKRKATIIVVFFHEAPTKKRKATIISRVSLHEAPTKNEPFLQKSKFS